MKSIRCGAFRAQKIDFLTWVITCDHLPELRHTIFASEYDVLTVLFRIQAEYRDKF